MEERISAIPMIEFGFQSFLFFDSIQVFRQGNTPDHFSF